MRRIALVCDWYHPRRGGIEAHLDGLATRLVTRGTEVEVITSTPGSDWVNGVRVHRLDVPRIPVAGVAALPVARHIERLLARGRFTLVHSHVSIVAPVALGGAIGAHRAGLPSVLTFHSFIPATPVLAAIAGRAVGSARWLAVMTAVSNRVIREVRAFAPAVPFHVLPNAVDTAFWKPGETIEARDHVHFVYAGRLQPKKRPLLLLRVLRELAQSGVGAWRLTVIGAGTLDKTLRLGVQRLGLDDRVSFVGWVDRQSLRDILRGADVFLSTAVRESFGIAALEACATGVPVVAVRDSAVSDFVAHERSGLLAEDEAAFAAAAVRLARDEALRTRLAAFCRQTRLPYDWESTLRLHDAAYGRAEQLVRAER